MAAAFPSKKNRRMDAMAAFYQGQNEHIKGLLKPLSVHAEEAVDAEGANRSKVSSFGYPSCQSCFD